MSTVADAEQPLLQLEHISLSFKEVRALTDVGFSVRRSEVCGLIGPNGAGKSSLLNVMSGVYRPQAGTITFDGVSQPRVLPRDAARRGMARTFQNLALFKGMTVLENLMTGRTLQMKATFLEQALFWGRARREEIEQRAKVEEILELCELGAYRSAVVGKLPYGLQKRVELGRALAAEPRLLLLDEPMAGMNVEEKHAICRYVLDHCRRFGTTVVLIEHDMSVVMDISDHVVVLDYGRKIADGSPDEIRRDQAVIDAYLGVAHEATDARGEEPSTDRVTYPEPITAPRGPSRALAGGPFRSQEKVL